jgi:hypothetical protein
MSEEPFEGVEEQVVRGDLCFTAERAHVFQEASSLLSFQ